MHIYIASPIGFPGRTSPGHATVRCYPESARNSTLSTDSLLPYIALGHKRRESRHAGYRLGQHGRLAHKPCWRRWRSWWQCYSFLPRVSRVPLTPTCSTPPADYGQGVDEEKWNRENRERCAYNVLQERRYPINPRRDPYLFTRETQGWNQNITW